MAGLKLIAGIVVVLLIAGVLVFGKPLTGFSVLSLVGLDSQNTPDEYAKNKAMLEEVLKENPERAARLDDYGRNELERAISQDKGLTKELLQGILESVTQTSEEAAEIERELSELKYLTPEETGGYEESFVIGGKTYTESELQQMNQEQLDALRKTKESEDAGK